MLSTLAVCGSPRYARCHEPALRADEDQRVRANVRLAAAKHGAVNLGQGFPDFGWPDEILDAAARALDGGLEPICSVARTAGAARGGRGPLQSPSRPSSSTADQVCVTSGATEALGAAILATISRATRSSSSPPPMTAMRR